MTWNPLKKNQLCVKPTAVPQILPRQKDRELENIFIQLQILEDNTRKLQKEIKIYMDGLVNLNKAEQKLTNDLSSSQICQQDDEIRKIVEEYLSVTSKVNDSVQEVVRICQKALVDPLKKYSGEFSGIASNLNKREQAVQEVIRQEIRLKKLEEKEKTATNIVKREQSKKSIQSAKDEVEAIHRKLLHELPGFYSLRTAYFTPCLQALIRAQVSYHGTTLKLFTDLNNTAVKGASTSGLTESEIQYSSRTQGHLNIIESLNIVGQPISRQSM